MHWKISSEMAAILFQKYPHVWRNFFDHLQTNCQLEPWGQTLIKFNWNSNIFLRVNAFENVVCKISAILFRPPCIKSTIVLSTMGLIAFNNRVGKTPCLVRPDWNGNLPVIDLCVKNYSMLRSRHVRNYSIYYDTKAVISQVSHYPDWNS